jgi:hypothetical protein
MSSDSRRPRPPWLEHYSTAEETVAKIGFPPGRKPGQLGFIFRA